MAIKRFLFFILAPNSIFVFSQHQYAVMFTDKNNSPYSINNPQQYLSQKAIDRRIKNGISITQEDLPVNQNYIDSVIAKGAILVNK